MFSFFREISPFLIWKHTLVKIARENSENPYFIERCVYFVTIAYRFRCMKALNFKTFISITIKRVLLWNKTEWHLYSLYIFWILRWKFTIRKITKIFKRTCFFYMIEFHLKVNTELFLSYSKHFIFKKKLRVKFKHVTQCVKFNDVF